MKTEGKYLDILAQCYNNILLFAVSLLPAHFSKKPALFHKEIFSLLSKKSKLNCIVAPRGHSKSTTVSLAYILHQILFKQANFIIIISDTHTQAKYFLDAIKKELETNEMIKWLFGEMKGGTWGESEIETSNNVRVIIRGADQKIRGLKFRQFRPDLIVVDDLENDELVSSKERRVKLEKWFFGSVLPALADNGRIVVIGTILHYDSLLNKLSKNPHFSSLFYKAVMNGKPLWEAKYSLKDIKAIKQNYINQGLRDTFYCEYMNEPLSDDNAIFKKNYFKYYKDDKVLIDSLQKFITVDLAISEKESADYTVVMVSGIDALNQIYILEYERDRFTPIETIEHIFTLAEKWEISAIGVESVAYQRSLIWFLQDEMKRRNKFFMIQELKADKDKERRIRGLQPRYASGQVFHKPHHTELEEELILFPKAPHDDLADALAYVPQIAFPAGGISQMPDSFKPGSRGDAANSDNLDVYTQY